MRAVCLALLILLLLALAYNGLYEGSLAARHAATPGMRVAAATQLLYGVFGLAALLAMGLRPAWVTPLLCGTGAASCLTAGLAPVVYGGATVSVGIVSALITAVLFVLAIWCWRNLLRSPTGSRQPAAGNRAPSSS